MTTWHHGNFTRWSEEVGQLFDLSLIAHSKSYEWSNIYTAFANWNFNFLRNLLCRNPHAVWLPGPAAVLFWGSGCRDSHCSSQADTFLVTGDSVTGGRQGACRGQLLLTGIILLCYGPYWALLVTYWLLTEPFWVLNCICIYNLLGQNQKVF